MILCVLCDLRVENCGWKILNAEDAEDAELFMAVVVHLSGYLKPFSGGETEIAFESDFATVAEVLDSLFTRHPALRDRVLDEQSEIRQHVNIFVGSDDVKRIKGLMTEVKDGEIHIFNAVSGG